MAIPVEDMAFDSLEQMWIRETLIKIMPPAKRLIAKCLHIPLTYLQRCPRELQAWNLKEDAGRLSAYKAG